MRSRSSIDVVVTALLVLLFVGAAPLAQGAKPSGAASPQEAVAAIKKATAANDMLQALPVISPRGLKVIANEGVTGVLMVLAFSDPDDAMPGSAKPAKAELDAKRKKYQAGQGPRDADAEAVRARHDDRQARPGARGAEVAWTPRSTRPTTSR